MPDTLERIYTVPLGKAYETARTSRVPSAIKLLRIFIERHMKARGGTVILSSKLNEHLWAHSIQRPPRRVKVRLIKEAGIVRAYLPDEKPGEEKKAEGKKEKPEASEKKEAEGKPEPSKASPEKKQEPAKEETAKKPPAAKPAEKKEEPKAKAENRKETVKAAPPKKDEGKPAEKK